MKNYAVVGSLRYEITCVSPEEFDTIQMIHPNLVGVPAVYKVRDDGSINLWPQPAKSIMLEVAVHK